MDWYGGGGLRKISKFKQVLLDLTLTVIEFHRVGAATEKALVPTFVLTLGTKSRLELDDRIYMGFLAEVSSECNYIPENTT